MTRLELIVNDKNPSRDEMREQLDAYIDGFVSEDMRAAIEAALAQDDALRAEYEALRRTMSLLHQTDRPAPPVDMVARVRHRLAAERAAPMPGDDEMDKVVDLAERRLLKRAVLFTASVGIAAAAALFVVVGLPQMAEGGAHGVAAAGLSLGARAATISVADVAATDVEMLASEAGLTMLDGTLVFEGTGAEVARFVFKLRSDKQAEVRGVVPDGERIRLTVKLTPGAP